MRPEAQPASANNNPIVTMRRMIANPLQAFSSHMESLGGSENATKNSFPTHMLTESPRFCSEKSA
jgi:hypothetical protein